MIDGFRYGFFGASDVAPGVSLAVVARELSSRWRRPCLMLLKSGYKLRT